MKHDIRKFVAECEVCQCNKREIVKSLGTLQPLMIPPAIWKDISMDFITSLPKSGNKSVIMCGGGSPFQICSFLRSFTTHLLHPQWLKFSWTKSSRCMACRTLLFSDRDPIFTRNFWQELFKLQGTQLHLSSAYHPQTDGQTEVVNKCLETYLRCFASEKQHQWAKWLPLAEWWYNTTYHIATCMTPFEAVYGQKPPSILSYLPGTSKV
jgi:hypothetical protein